MFTDPRLKNPLQKVIYLDLDGVLTDFDRQLKTYLSLQNYSNAEYQSWISANKGIANRLPREFWEGLPWTPFGKTLFAQCKQLAPVVILTSPGDSWESSGGKHAWLLRELKTRDFIISGDKWLLANSNAMLIDDRRKNTEAFTRHGGHTFLYTDLTESTFNNAIKAVKDFINGNVSS